jgi:hypothetical protein
MFADYGEYVDGFAVIAYQDAAHKTYAGLIDMVTSILLVREDLDPDPVYDDRKDKSAATASTDMSALTALDSIIRQGIEDLRGDLLAAGKVDHLHGSTVCTVSEQ